MQDAVHRGGAWGEGMANELKYLHALERFGIKIVVEVEDNHE